MGNKSKKRKKRHNYESLIHRDDITRHPEAYAALNIIQSHGAIDKGVGPPKMLGDGTFIIKFNIDVKLPSRARKRGMSQTGVMSQESVILHFPSTYPFHAPTIKLRPNFNRSLPHINPSFGPDNGDYVYPCVYDGSLDDLLHQEGDGLSEILNHLSDWLGKAAIDDLIDPHQGWEPIRRDENFGWIVYDLSGMRSLVQDRGNALVFQCRFLKDRFRQRDSYFVWGIDYEKSKPITPWLMQDSFYADKSPDGAVYGSLIIFTWPNKVGKATKTIADQYLPENVQNLEQLFERARDYGCDVSFRSAFFDFCWALKNSSLNMVRFPLFIILCAQRPCPLIGDDSQLELVPYVIDCRVDKMTSPIPEIATKIMNDSPVLSLGHRHKVSSKLLRRMSGGKIMSSNGTVVHIGCGSVGSKIAMHLARSGYGPLFLIDNGVFSPHNAARHALTLIPEVPGQRKATLLAKEIKLLRQEAEPIVGDIIEICKNPKNDINPFPKDTHLIIESTGSIAVREMLATLPPKKITGRLFHTALYEHGKIGIIAVEGHRRNPTVNDLLARFWDERIDNPKLGSKFSDHAEGLSREDVGLGCGSHSMIMPDSLVSLFAAGMAERARQIIENRVSENGELWIGLLDDYEMGINWKQLVLGQTRVLKVKAQNEWEVRILKGALDQIAQEVEIWRDTETGGVLIGQISLPCRCFLISRVLQAPPDSERYETSFILGVDGLRKRVQEIGKKSGGTLGYVGTWHSHPRGGLASSIDRACFERIRRLRFGSPSLGLIWTHSGFKALIDEGKLT